MLRKKFTEWRWENYDGDRPSDPNRISINDIERVYQLGSRTPRQAYQSVLEKNSETISQHLKAIPQHLALEDDALSLSDLRQDLEGLFDIFLQTKSIKLAGTTKLLSPFRPALIPVVDSIIEYYYWYATSIANERSFRKLERAFKESRPCGEYLFCLLELMRDDVRGARTEIDRVRHACGDQPYAKASRVRVVESLLWFYYARGGGSTEFVLPDKTSDD
jgi:hypothetical protein